MKISASRFVAPITLVGCRKGCPRLSGASGFFHRPATKREGPALLFDKQIQSHENQGRGFQGSAGASRPPSLLAALHAGSAPGILRLMTTLPITLRACPKSGWHGRLARPGRRPADRNSGCAGQKTGAQVDRKRCRHSAGRVAQQDRRVACATKNGVFGHALKAREALRHNRRQELRKEIQEGIEQLERGETSHFKADDVKAEGRRILAGTARN